MKKTVFMDKYPVYTLEIQKNETTLKNVDEFIAYYKEKIEAHPVSTFIAIFDHYKHTKNLNGSTPEGMIDAKNLIFCFGASIPSTKILAVRPRSIGIAEMQNSFIIEFIEVPNEKLHNVVENWTKEISNTYL